MSFYKTLTDNKENELYSLRMDYLHNIVGDKIWEQDWSNRYKDTLEVQLDKHLTKMLTEIITKSDYDDFKLSRFDERLDCFDANWDIYYKYNLIILSSPDGYAIYTLRQELGASEKIK